jgi:hypothetical protein
MREFTTGAGMKTVREYDDMFFSRFAILKNTAVYGGVFPFLFQIAWAFLRFARGAFFSFALKFALALGTYFRILGGFRIVNKNLIQIVVHMSFY